MWSVGVSLFELYTGKILFPGHTNNQMLKMMMELKGKLPNKVLKRGEFTTQHFNEQFQFLLAEKGGSGKEVSKVVNLEVKKDIKSRLLTRGDGERPLVENFADLLEKILTLSPEKRMTVEEAMAHPFIIGK